ncbi:MAG: glycosyltransferase family 39 protein [bacterium]|nr:glycosyltransferase family 39 protein [bacterium]
MIAVVVQLALTIPLSFILNINQEDAYTLHSTAYGAAYALHEAIFFEQNAPLYFVAMALWRVLGQSHMVASLFSVICAAITVLMVPRLMDRYMPGVRRSWVLFAFALNPFVIAMAVEIRLYALLMLLSALLLITFFDAFLAQRPSRRALAVYGALCAASLYTEYYMLFLILAQGVLLCGLRYWEGLRRYVITQVLVALAFLPMMIVIPWQMANFRGSFTYPNSLLASIKILAEIFLQYILPLTIVPHHKELYAGIAISAIVGAYLLRRYRTDSGQLLIPALFAAAFFIFAVAVYVGKMHVLYRHGALLLVPALLTPFALLTCFREPARTRAVRAVGLTILAASVLTLFLSYRHGAKPGDWRRVAAYLDRHVKQGQPILVFEPWEALPLDYYYRGSNEIVAIPRPIDFKGYDVDDLVLRNDAQIVAALARVPGDRRTLWLVTMTTSCQEWHLDYGCGVLESYVSRHYRTLERQPFYGSEVRLLVRRSS